MARPIILVVEDEPAVRIAAAEALAEAGFDVLEAADAARALAELPGGIDLLFTDIVMPGAMDGVELARRARALNPRLPVIIASGGGHAHAVNGQMVEGALFFAKPYRLETVVAAIRETLNRR